MRSFQRIFRRRVVRQGIVLALVLVSIFDITQVLRALSTTRAEPAPRRPERVYIASIHWNNEHILRSHWNDAVIALAGALGRENVYVSVFESGSWDESKDALKELDLALEAQNIRRNITLSDTTHGDEISATPQGPGWVDTPRGKKELRRIPYLARLRNWTLEPLQELVRQGEKFDKILFLSDVVFTDVFRLLDTNNGDFAAACALDFSHPPQVYDTFALRDAEGHEMLMPTWPYFRARQSRQAILANLPAPVASCWNGIVAMPAEPFVSKSPLRFRGIPDSLAALHLEGSECCLIHIDNPLVAKKQIYVNPNVLVGYNPEAYNAVHPQRILRSHLHILTALWENRIRRWFTSPWLSESRVQNMIKEWQGISKGNEERGSVCVINEMQVLAENGWAHI